MISCKPEPCTPNDNIKFFLVSAGPFYPFFINFNYPSVVVQNIPSPGIFTEGTLTILPRLYMKNQISHPHCSHNMWQKPRQKAPGHPHHREEIAALWKWPKRLRPLWKLPLISELPSFLHPLPILFDLSESQNFDRLTNEGASLQIISAPECRG